MAKKALDLFLGFLMAIGIFLALGGAIAFFLPLFLSDEIKPDILFFGLACLVTGAGLMLGSYLMEKRWIKLQPMPPEYLRFHLEIFLAQISFLGGASLIQEGYCIIGVILTVAPLLFIGYRLAFVRKKSPSDKAI